MNVMLFDHKLTLELHLWENILTSMAHKFPLSILHNSKFVFASWSLLNFMCFLMLFTHKKKENFHFHFYFNISRESLMHETLFDFIYGTEKKRTYNFWPRVVIQKMMLGKLLNLIKLMQLFSLWMLLMAIFIFYFWSFIFDFIAFLFHKIKSQIFLYHLLTTGRIFYSNYLFERAKLNCGIKIIFYKWKKIAKFMIFSLDSLDFRFYMRS